MFPSGSVDGLGEALEVDRTGDGKGGVVVDGVFVDGPDGGAAERFWRGGSREVEAVAEGAVVWGERVSGRCGKEIGEVGEGVRVVAALVTEAFGGEEEGGGAGIDEGAVVELEVAGVEGPVLGEGEGEGVETVAGELGIMEEALDVDEGGCLCDADDRHLGAHGAGEFIGGEGAEEPGIVGGEVGVEIIGHQHEVGLATADEGAVEGGGVGKVGGEAAGRGEGCGGVGEIESKAFDAGGGECTDGASLADVGAKGGAGIEEAGEGEDLGEAVEDGGGVLVVVGAEGVVVEGIGEGAGAVEVGGLDDVVLIGEKEGWPRGGGAGDGGVEVVEGGGEAGEEPIDFGELGIGEGDFAEGAGDLAGLEEVLLGAGECGGIEGLEERRNGVLVIGERRVEEICSPAGDTGGVEVGEGFVEAVGGFEAPEEAGGEEEGGGEEEVAGGAGEMEAEAGFGAGAHGGSVPRGWWG
jgi:hypothetical protein